MRSTYYPKMNNLRPTENITHKFYMREVEKNINKYGYYPDYFLQKLIQCDSCKHYFSFNMYHQDYLDQGDPYKYIYRDFEKNRYKKNICHYCESDKLLTYWAKGSLSAQGIRSHMLNHDIIEFQKIQMLTKYLLNNRFHNQPYMKFKTTQI